MTDQITRMKILIEFMNRGIVPIGSTGAPTWSDVNRVLAAFPLHDARTMKRKFRKMWRKIVKNHLSHGGRRGDMIAKELGYGVATPVRKHKNARKAAVVRDVVGKTSLWSEVIQ